MPRKPAKKGPHRVTVSKTITTKERTEFRDKLDAFAAKLHGAIEKARAKMTPAEREKADRGADAILRNAIAEPKRSRQAG